MPEEISSRPSPGGGGAAGEVVDGMPAAAATTTTVLNKEDRKKWFIEMRGWIMVLAVQVASFTYQAGFNPPGGFCHDDDNCKGNGEKALMPVLESADNFRYKVFFYSNTTAFVTSLAIIILLMNKSFYGSLAKVLALEIIVVLDMMGLMAAYWAGSTRKDQTNMFALVLTALVLFVVYVVYAVQLGHKVWRLFSAVRRRAPVVTPARDATARDDGAPPVPKQQNVDDARAPPTLDVGRSTSELRRRDSRPAARTSQTGPSTMLSP